MYLCFLLEIEGIDFLKFSFLFLSQQRIYSPLRFPDRIIPAERRMLPCSLAMRLADLKVPRSVGFRPVHAVEELQRAS